MDREKEVYSELPLNIFEFHKNFTSDFGLLTLKDNDSENEDKNDASEEHRPVTPIKIAVKKAPKTLEEMKELVHKRLHLSDDVKTVKHHDQLQLASILMSELNLVWPDIRKQAPDPFLDNAENRELERRVAIEVVTTIEQLYECYIRKLKDANLKGVFSSASNVSRLKTQLSIEASKCLNILSIRRKLAHDLRHQEKSDGRVSEDSFITSVKEKLLQKAKKPVPVGRIARKLQLTRMQAEKLHRTMELAEIDEKIQKLDMTKVPDVGILNRRRRHEIESIAFELPAEQDGADEIISPVDQQATDKLTGHNEIVQTKLQKSHSLPFVDTAQLFLEELELDFTDIKSKRQLSIDRDLDHLRPELDSQDDYVERHILSPRIDLQNLMLKEMAEHNAKKSNEVHEIIPEDMPPLLQALPINQKDRIHRKREEKGHELMDADSSSVASTISTIKAINDKFDKDGEKNDAVHFQPAVVSKKLTNKDVVRTSDVRVSSRENISQIALKKHEPIYNSFKGEIDDAIVKCLDANLFAGDEIKEVYEEVAKTLNAEHLQFDQDDFVVKCPARLQAVDRTLSNLHSKVNGSRIVNQDLVKRKHPPWNEEGAHEWINRPKFGGLGRQDILQEKVKREFRRQDQLVGQLSQKKPTHSYSAWLAWWRSTINSEDFYKYLCSKENDFLSNIFHLYDSEDEGDETVGSTKLTKEDAEALSRKEQVQKRLAQLEAIKKEYKKGFWNVNTIILGGLGKLPAINEAEAANGKGSHDMSAADPQSMIKISANETAEYSAAFQDALQDRLEKVWNRLKMPDNVRLDMAIKYSLDKYNESLLEVISSWESAAECILQREDMISALEKFERVASDPNRFFEKGTNSSPFARMEESKTRDALHKELNKLDDVTKKAISIVNKRFQDVVTYKGRPYHEKMASDKIEMLFWLQQERRATFLNSSSISDKKSKSSDLPPIATVNLL